MSEGMQTPKYELHQAVDHVSSATKRGGKILEIHAAAVFVAYVVQFPHCGGFFFESELVPAAEQEGVKHE